MNPDARPAAHERVVHAARLLGLAAAYVVAGTFGLSISPVSGFATLVWPPSGLALAALLLGGYRLWPAIAAGAFLTNLWAGAPPLVACGIAAGNTLEAVGAAVALRCVPGFQPALHRFTDVVALTVLGGLVSTTLSASIGVASLALGGVILPASISQTWLVWWTGDLVGDLIVAPALLTWAGGWRGDVCRATPAEAASLGAALLACAWLVFGTPLGTALRLELLRPYILFLPLIWAALRFGTRGAATAVLVTAVVAVAGTYTGHGPFVRAAGTTESLIALHVFLSTASVASLALGAVVCERERSRHDVGEHEALLHAILDGATDCIFVKDRRGRYVTINLAGARLLGVPPEAVIGKDDSALFPAAEARMFRHEDVDVVLTEAPQATEQQLVIAGEPRVYLTTKTPYRDRAGRVLGVLGIARDITERKNEELARARLAAIVESSEDAVIGESLDGTITSWNAAAQRLYGYTPEEAIGQPMAMLVPPERREELAALLSRMRAGERIKDCDIVRRCKDGTTVDVALTTSPVRDAAGAVVGFATTGRDVTEVAERQRLAVEAAHLGLWFWNLSNGRLVWTPLCREMYGIGPDEGLSHARFLATLHPDDRASTEQAVSAAIEGASDYRVEHRALWPDGSVRWISVLGRVYLDEEGAPDRMLGVTRDVTAQKQVEQERADLLVREQAARAEAEEATRAKDEFLTVLSHELRTPLTSILGWTQILLGRAEAAPVAAQLAIILRNAKVQLQIVSDLLDMSQIMANKLRLDAGPVVLSKIVGAAVDTTRPAAEAKGISLSWDPWDEAVPHGDPDRLKQVFWNLLSNAVKFTAEGGRIEVSQRRAGSSVEVRVTDTGQGIEPEFLPHLFERFRQADASTSRKHGGLGLGLAIVQQIVELHGGTVRAESGGAGTGATFTVALPLMAAEDAATPASTDHPRATTLDPSEAARHRSAA